jgi:hypothetical protein
MNWRAPWFGFAKKCGQSPTWPPEWQGYGLREIRYSHSRRARRRPCSACFHSNSLTLCDTPRASCATATIAVTRAPITAAFFVSVSAMLGLGMESFLVRSRYDVVAGYGTSRRRRPINLVRLHNRGETRRHRVVGSLRRALNAVDAGVC